MNLKEKSFQIREDILDMIYRAKAGHIGGDFSVADTMVALYYDVMNVSPETVRDPNRDRFILSKGHSAEALYSVLADRGFFPKEDLLSYCRFGSKFIGHPNNKIPGVEMNSGSLGHGLPVAVGMALAGKMDDAPYRVYTVMGDGELAEGSVWEGAMAAGHYHLDNLTAVVDRNRLQISGTTEEVMQHDNMTEQFRSFGWVVTEAEGNDPDAMAQALREAAKVKGAPVLVVANTIKGYGVSFIENKAVWHHRVPGAEEYEAAKKELQVRREAAHAEDRE